MVWIGVESIFLLSKPRACSWLSASCFKVAKRERSSLDRLNVVSSPMIFGTIPMICKGGRSPRSSIIFSVWSISTSCALPAQVIVSGIAENGKLYTSPICAPATFTVSSTSTESYSTIIGIRACASVPPSTNSTLWLDEVNA